MRIPSVVTSLLKQSKHSEFLLAILQWEIFHGDNAVLKGIVDLFFSHVRNQTAYQKIAMLYLHRISRNNRINVSCLQQQKNKIYHTLLQQTTKVTENNIQAYITQNTEQESCNYLYRERYFPSVLSPYLLVVSTIESICNCFEVNEEQLLECVYKGILNIEYQCEKVVFDYNEIVDFLFPREHTQQFIKIPEAHLSQILSLIANGKMMAFHCENELYIHKPDLEKYVSTDLDANDLPRFAQTTTSFINEIPIRDLQKMLRLKQRDETFEREKPNKFGLFEGKRVLSLNKSSKVFFKAKGKKSQILKKIKAFLKLQSTDIRYECFYSEEDEKSVESRLQHGIKKQKKVLFEAEQDKRKESEVVSSFTEKKSETFDRSFGGTVELSDDDEWIDERRVSLTHAGSISEPVDFKKLQKKLPSKSKISVWQRIFNITVIPIKIPIVVFTIAYSTTKFLFLGVVNAFKILLLHVKRLYIKNIAGIDIPIFEAMLSEEAGRPGIVERTIAQSKLVIKSLQVIIGLRVLVAVHLVDSLLDFIVGYVNSIYRTWKISKSIKKRLKRRDSNKQIEGINRELQVVRYEMSRLFCLPHFCPYARNNYIDETVTLELILEIRYRLDEMKRDLSILTTSQMQETAKKSLWDFLKSFVPNPME